MSIFQCNPTCFTTDCLQIVKKFCSTEIEGYLLYEFVQKTPSVSNEYYGVITDKKFKLDVIVYTNTDVHIPRRSKIEIIGDLQEADVTFCLYVKDPERIQIIEEDALPLEMMFKGYEIILNQE